MKKLTVFFFIITIILFSLLPIAQASVRTNVPELSMSMDVPDNWVIFNRMIDANNPNLTHFGLDKASLDQFMKDNNIYLNAVDTNTHNEIIVTMVESDDTRKAFDLNLASEKEIHDAAEQLKNNDQNKSKEITLLDFTVLKHKQAKFIDYNRCCTQNNQKAYGKQYTTIINGQTISIIYNSYSGQPLAAEEIEQMRNTINSIEFSKVLQKPFQLDGTLGTVVKGAGIGLFAGLLIYLFKKIKKWRFKNRQQSVNAEPK